ncbi:MAG: LamG-like jellyroll fold domain-containing protein, partial [Planctomycetota bacterium]
MSKKLIYLISFVLLLGLISDASAELVAHWRLDEGSGTTVADAIGNIPDGTFEGDPQWVAGKFGTALEFDGDDWVNFGTPPDLVINGTISITCWVNPTGFVGRQGFVGLDAGYAFKVHEQGRLCFTTPGIVDHESASTILEAGTWQHVAAVFQPGQSEGMVFYLNGVETDRLTSSAMNAGSGPFRIGSNQWNETLTGMIDDVRVYNHVLMETEILAAMEGSKGYAFAFGPTPADGAIHADTWVNLSWRAGDFAVSHDVYLGENLDDVNNGAEGTFQGNQASTFLVAGFPGFSYPDGLVPGTTYYWRVDEVNDTDPNSPWKGDVWSFMIPPKTAYFPDPADNAESIDPDANFSWTAGFGAKLHTVYFGDNFDDVNNAAGGLPQGATTYTPPGTLKLAKTYYWRVDEFDAIATYKGDVWSFTTQGAVGSPDPSNGAVDVKQTQIITFSPGVFAASHELYFGTDKDAVKNADTGSPEYKRTRDLGAESYDPGMLEWDTAYYWRIDEVNNTNPDSPWTGILWSFTTANFLIVDDFESYNDLDPADPESNRIFNVWIDGYDNPANGSLVGYDTPPFAEQT